MDFVYLVWFSYYCDPYIERAFRSKEDAEEYISSQNEDWRGGYTIEEEELY